MTVLRSGSATDVGRVRTSNQDVALEGPALFAVADGMGGHVGGEVAARVAIDALHGAFERQPTVEGLRRAVAEANRAVWRQSQTERELRGMGTTLTATALVDEESGRQVIALANVGDSRAYVFSGSQRELIQVTADHSLAEEKVRMGQLTEAEAEVHPHRHILTRALGVSSDVDVDLWELHLHAGDRILLCSDGLTNEVTDERIRDVLAKVGDPAGAAKRLVRAALDHGGRDNVTVVVVDVISSDGPAAGAVALSTAATGPVPGEHPEVVAPDGAAAGDAGGGTAGGAGEARPSGAGPAASATWETPTAGDGSAPAVRVLPGSTGMALVPQGQTAPGVTEVGDVAESPTPPPPGPARPASADAVASATASGAAARGGLQADALRRWQTTGHTRRERRRRRRSAGMPRLVTVRVVLFFILLAAIVAGGYALLRWYANDDWYVTVDHNHLAVYQGRPGGFAWFKPTLVEVTPVTTKEVLQYRLPTVRHDKQEPSLAAARRYVRNLHSEYCTSRTLSSGGVGTTGASTGSAPASGTTGASTGSAPASGSTASASSCNRSGAG